VWLGNVSKHFTTGIPPILDFNIRDKKPLLVPFMNIVLMFLVGWLVVTNVGLPVTSPAFVPRAKQRTNGVMVY